MTYPKSVYGIKDVGRAIEDYGNICRISATETSTEIICTFSKSIADLERTVLEFSNYLIELANVGELDGNS